MGRRGVFVTSSPMTFADLPVEQRDLEEDVAAEPSVEEAGSERLLDEDFLILQWSEDIF